MIGVHKQEKLIDDLVARLDARTRPAHSVDLVVPPGFGEHALAAAVRERLLALTPPPAVALINADLPGGATQFLQELHRQWGLPEPSPAPRPDGYADADLPGLLDNGDGRPRVLILGRFFRLLDAIGVSMLYALRNAEQTRGPGRLTTLVITGHPIDWIKAQWRRDSGDRNPLLASDYGDTHAQLAVEPPTLHEVSKALPPGLYPDRLVADAYGWTGGYPEPMSAVLRECSPADAKHLEPRVRQRLREVACQQLKPMAYDLDLDGGNRFRRCVIDLHHGRESIMAGIELTVHPWAKLLRPVVETDDPSELAPDTFEADASRAASRLRAECLGEVASTLDIESAVHAGLDSTEASTALQVERATELYHLQQYDDVVRLLKPLRIKSAASSVLRRHAAVMAALRGGGDALSLDTDWKAVLDRLAEARDDVRAWLRPAAIRSLDRRYKQIEDIAKTVLAGKGKNRRLLDEIGAQGAVAGGEVSRDVVYQLLVLHYQAGCAISGNSAAVQSVLALPEQIFRIWARWHLGLDYNSVPEENQSAWDAVEKHLKWTGWTAPKPNEKFGSFREFAYFAYVVACERSAGDTDAVRKCCRDLDEQLSRFDLRNDAAHASIVVDRRSRTEYFKVILRWLGWLEQTGELTITYAQARKMSAALPLVDTNGDLLR